MGVATTRASVSFVSSYSNRSQSFRPSLPCCAVMTASLLWGCGSSEGDRASPATSPQPTDSQVPAPDDAGGTLETVDNGDLVGVECEGEAVSQCSVDLGTYNGVHSCATGVQFCTEGRWGPCEEGSMEDQ